MSEQHFQESIDTFKVKFEGGNTVDAALFAKTINNTIELVKASAKAIDPDAFLRLEIKATQEGSFETTIDAVVKYSKDLLPKDNITLATEIVAGYLAFLQIKQLLSDKKAKTVISEGNKTTITNEEDKSLTIPTTIYNQYFVNSTIDSVIVNQSNDLKSSNRSMSVAMQNKNVQFTQEDYENMSKPIEDLTKESNISEQIQTLRCTLTIKKPDLIGNSQWEVILDKKINVKISDEAFLLKIKKREIHFLSGDSLVCDLQIVTKLDDNYNVIGTEYTVIKVDSIKTNDDQMDLFKN